MKPLFLALLGREAGGFSPWSAGDLQQAAGGVRCAGMAQQQNGSSVEPRLGATAAGIVHGQGGL